MKTIPKTEIIKDTSKIASKQVLSCVKGGKWDSHRRPCLKAWVKHKILTWLESQNEDQNKYKPFINVANNIQDKMQENAGVVG